MKIHVKLILVILVLITRFNVNAKETQSSDYLKYVSEIVDGFVNHMEKKYKLHCYGSGGSMPTDVEKINVLFACYKKSTVDDARKMEIDAIQELLQRINSHEKIRPYLREYPFGVDRVGVTISFRTNTDGRPLDGSVAHVSTGINKIFYYTAEMIMSKPIPLTRIYSNNQWTKEIVPGKLQEELVPLMEETYEEALKIVGINHCPN